ncbi:sigma-70 family RNA polymerase sigma factor [bacterium]|nr:sigma-70 family RNA polymerase sigma factor [bacterium]
MTDSHDNLLVQGTLDGDMESFRLLVDRYRNVLFNLAYRLTQDRETAEDMAQETFIRAYENLDKFDQERGFFTWLYTICTNLTINELKKKSRLKKTFCTEEIDKKDGEKLSTWTNEQLAEGERNIENKRQQKLLNEIIWAIPDEYRTAVILRYKEELSYREIADILKISVSLAKVRVHRGIEKLRNLFREMGYEGET